MYLKVMESLNIDLPIQGSFSTFGKIPFGYYTMGRLYYDVYNTDTDYACKNITTINLEPEAKEDRYPIVMVDRGNCTFVTKTRNVQNLGGHMAIIVNNNDESINDILMIDDGTASDIQIQAVLISQSDGEKIKQFIRNNEGSKVLEDLILSIEYKMV
jgi:hypothetical protein